MGKELLKAQIFDKSFGDKRVLEDIDFNVAQGEIVAIVGPSGCGKSTLLRIIAGLDRDYDGSVVFEGRKHDKITEDVGFIFQEPRLFPWLTVADNVSFKSGQAGKTDPIVSHLLGEMGLAGYENAWPKQLSGGQAQRAAIARGLYTQPKLLLLDEPFSAVDAFTRMKLQELLVSVAQEHAITLVLVTHDIDEALYLADRLVIMGAHPGIIRDILDVDIPRPRDRRDRTLSDLRANVLTELYAVHAI